MLRKRLPACASNSMYVRSIGYEDEHRGQEQNSSTQCHNGPDVFLQEVVARLSRHSSRVTLERVYGIVLVLLVRTCSSRSVSELQLKPRCLYDDRSPRRMEPCGLLFSRRRLTQTVLSHVILHIVVLRCVLREKRASAIVTSCKHALVAHFDSVQYVVGQHSGSPKPKTT